MKIKLFIILITSVAIHNSISAERGLGVRSVYRIKYVVPPPAYSCSSQPAPPFQTSHQCAVKTIRQ